MNTSNRDFPDNKIDAKLKAVAEALATPPPWYDAWTKLTEDADEEERLAVYLAIRRSGTLPDEASFFLVSSLVDEIAAQDEDAELGDYADRLVAFEEQYGFSDRQIWPAGAAPAGYEELWQKYFQAWGELFARKLEQVGESDLARLFRTDQEGFNEFTEAGRQYFFGPEDAPVLWLRRLVEAVASCLEANGPMGPIGYQHGEEDGLWQLDLYPTPVELLGGAVDGEVVIPGFALDIEALRGLFDRIDAVTWQSLGFPDDEGPRFSIGGVYEGHDVFIQVLAYAPEDEEPGMKLDTRREP